MHKPYYITESKIAHANSHRISEPITIDGDLDKPVWRKAERSRRFVDLVTGEPGFLDTRMASLWDDTNLYLAYWLEEPLVRATLTQRDSLIWNDNDVELFLDGEDCYYELEINAFNTIYEVLFVYEDALKKGSRFDCPQFDLLEQNVDILGGFQDPGRYKTYHRGKRWAFRDFDFPGLSTAVAIQGTINDPRQADKGWTVEIALPWKGFATLFPTRRFPPQNGDTLRAAFFRFEALQFHGETVKESVGWALNEHGTYDSHLPENFSYLHFTE